MKVDGRHWRSIWAEADCSSVWIIDQTLLLNRVATRSLRNLQDDCAAIIDMLVRGAPLIGAMAAYGIALATRHGASIEKLCRAGKKLLAQLLVLAQQQQFLSACAARLRHIL